jgi:hypothetical protein
MRDYARAARDLINVLGEEGARQLLLLLHRPDYVRADVFRQLHARGTHRLLEDALVDLEADDVMRGWLAEHLRLALGLS